MADLYGMINVPTVVWIDEAGRIVRPKATEFGTDLFSDLTGIRPEGHLAAIRAWVKDGTLELDEAGVREKETLPSWDNQVAKAEFALAWHLHQAGETAAAERHFVRAGELAPQDWTIRRGSMPIRGLDPFGEPLLELWQEGDGPPRYPQVTA